MRNNDSLELLKQIKTIAKKANSRIKVIPGFRNSFMIQMQGSEERFRLSHRTNKNTLDRLIKVLSQDNYTLDDLKKVFDKKIPNDVLEKAVQTLTEKVVKEIQEKFEAVQGELKITLNEIDFICQPVKNKPHVFKVIYYESHQHWQCWVKTPDENDNLLIVSPQEGKSNSKADIEEAAIAKLKNEKEVTEFVSRLLQKLEWNIRTPRVIQDGEGFMVLSNIDFDFTLEEKDKQFWSTPYKQEIARAALLYALTGNNDYSGAIDNIGVVRNGDENSVKMLGLIDWGNTNDKTGDLIQGMLTPGGVFAKDKFEHRSVFDTLELNQAFVDSLIDGMIKDIKYVKNVLKEIGGDVQDSLEQAIKIEKHLQEKAQTIASEKGIEPPLNQVNGSEKDDVKEQKENASGNGSYRSKMVTSKSLFAPGNESAPEEKKPKDATYSSIPCLRLMR